MILVASRPQSCITKGRKQSIKVSQRGAIGCVIGRSLLFAIDSGTYPQRNYGHTVLLFTSMSGFSLVML
uniref:Uncharacterized protein n=1 Tax=Trichuris muris TaxID=70415 RepID=A0A5S6QW32_TRIMR